MVMKIIVGAISTNCYFLYDKETKAAMVIDPGDNADAILKVIRENGFEVGYILLTHGHFDHILAAQGVKEATGAKLVVHKDDAPRLLSSAVEDYQPYLSGGYKEPKPDILAKDGETISFGPLEVKYVSTPGHTEGSCVILSGDVMFSGDTLFYRECGRCDLPGGDYNEMLRSLKKLALLPGDYTVYPGHGVKSTLSDERLHNPYIRQAMAR